MPRTCKEVLERDANAESGTYRYLHDAFASSWSTLLYWCSGTIFMTMVINHIDVWTAYCDMERDGGPQTCQSSN